jgi:VanZ family protein
VLHCADMGRRTGTLLLWTAVLAWAGVIFTLSAQPGSRLPGGWSVQGHFGVYAVLGVLLWLALGGRSAGVRGIVLAIVIASAYGITDEFHQSFVPQRTPDVFDWATDTVGAAVGVMLAWYFAGALERRRARPATSGEEATDSDAGQARDAD